MLFAVAIMKGKPLKVFNNDNIGSSSLIRLMDYIETLEDCLGKKATKEFLPMQPGDVQARFAMCLTWKRNSTTALQLP